MSMPSCFSSEEFLTAEAGMSWRIRFPVEMMVLRRQFLGLLFLAPVLLGWAVWSLNRAALLHRNLLKTAAIQFQLPATVACLTHSSWHIQSCFHHHRAFYKKIRRIRYSCLLALQSGIGCSPQQHYLGYVLRVQRARGTQDDCTFPQLEETARDAS